MDFDTNSDRAQSYTRAGLHTPKHILTLGVNVAVASVDLDVVGCTPRCAHGALEQHLLIILMARNLHQPLYISVGIHSLEPILTSGVDVGRKFGSTSSVAPSSACSHGEHATSTSSTTRDGRDGCLRRLTALYQKFSARHASSSSIPPNPSLQSRSSSTANTRRWTPLSSPPTSTPAP
jgi:hypothetical protein